jgi:hypothetical protein
MRLALVVGTFLLLASPRTAGADDPETGDLVLAGAGMAIPTYILGVAWHEGTHALVAKAYGAEITEIKLWPGFVDGRFYFGYTRWRGRLTPGETAFALIAPKLTDLVLLGGYATLIGFDALPDNDYAALALTVLATGAWVDFSKDIASWNPGNDVVRAHALRGRTREGQRWPYRLVHLSVSVAAGVVLWQGYAQIFEDEPDGTTTTAPRVRVLWVPVWSGSF